VESARKRKLDEGGFVNMIEVYFAMFTEFIINQNPVVVAMSLVSLFIAVVFLIIKGSSNLTPEEAVREESSSGSGSGSGETREKEEEDSSPVVEEVEEIPVKAAEKSPTKSSATKRRSRRTED
jgi:hypothetical protein